MWKFGERTCGLAIAGLCAVASGAAASGAWAPGLAVGARFDDHRTAAGPPAEFVTTTVTPQLGFTGGPGDWMVQALARRRFEFQGSAYRPPSRAGMPAADLATLQLGRAWSELSQVMVESRYERSRDLLDVDDRTVFVAGDARRWSGSAQASLARTEGEYHTDGWSYATPGVEDARASSWSARFLPVQHREDAWFVGWNQRELELGGSMAVRSRMASVGVRRRLSPLLTGELEVGPADLEYGDGARQRGPALIVGLHGPAAGDPTLATQWRLERNLATAVSAEINRRVGDGRAWARGESLVDVEGVVYRMPTLTRRLILGAQDTLARSFVLGFEASCTRTAPLHYAGAEISSVRASGWMERRLRPWLTGRGACSYLGQTGIGEKGAPAFRRVSALLD